MERVVRQVQLAQQVLGPADAEWNDISKALDELAHVIETLGLQQPMRDVARQLLPISSELGAQITGYRSKLVGEVCRHITRIVKVLRRDFRELANDLLPSLVGTAKGASRAVRQPGAALFNVISEHVRYDLQFFGKIFAQSPQMKIRVLMLEQLAVVLACWAKEEIEPYYGDVVEIVRRGLPDPANEVRSATRDILCSFAALWEERVEELVEIPSAPARDLLLKEKPHAVISSAILKKHPELQKKVGKTETTGKTIARQRSLYQKGASIESQDVEIHVATPPGKTRGNQANTAMHNDAVTQNPSIPRRLFQDDDSEKLNPVPAVSSVSGISRRSLSEVNAADSGASHIESQSPSTGIPAPPASTRPDDIFRRSRIEFKAESSRIPPPSTKSPVFRNKLTSRASSISRSQDSPPQESKISPSRIPKPTRATSLSMINFKLPTSKGPSKDDGDEKLSDARICRDRFLDSPIPSSAPTPTPFQPDSNVTVRARRRLTTSTAEENKLTAPDSIPVPVNVTGAFDEQPPYDEEKPVATVSAADAPSAEPLLLPRKEEEDLHPLEEEPLPPTTALSSAIFEQRRQQESYQAAEVTMLAMVEKATPGIKSSTQDSAVGSTLGDQLAVFIDADIEETMLVSREVTARDYAEKVPVAQERVRREEEGSDSSLTNDALENLRGIQEKMAKLQALTRMDVRGLPMKQRGGNIPESPVARPRSAGRMRTVFSEPLPQSPPQQNTTNASSIAPSRQTAERSGFPHQTRDSASTTNYFEVEKELTRDVANTRATKENKNDGTSRDFKPPVNRRCGPPHHTERDYEARQQDLPAQRRRVANQASADIDRELVERQFQGLVREAQAGSSRPSSSEQQTVVSRTSTATVRLSSQDPISNYAAPVSNGNVRRNATEPPLLYNAKPASEVNHREPSVTQPEDSSSAEETSRSPTAVHRSGARPGSSRTSQPNLERTAKHSWVSSYTGYFCLFLGFIFGASGVLRAATTVRDTHDYHQALKMRISMFEASISESYDSVRKLEENYAVWSEYVRALAEEDETHTLSLLETIQHEVEKWQVDMKHDLTQFKKSLSVDVVEAALAPLLKNATIEKGEL